MNLPWWEINLSVERTCAEMRSSAVERWLFLSVSLCLQKRRVLALVPRIEGYLGYLRVADNTLTLIGFYSSPAIEIHYPGEPDARLPTARTQFLLFSSVNVCLCVLSLAYFSHCTAQTVKLSKSAEEQSQNNHVVVSLRSHEIVLF